MENVREELTQECHREDCFLCRPNAALLTNVGDAGYTVAGLGPLADGYAVVATHDHLRGLAEADTELRSAYSSYAQRVADRLSRHYGGCLVVEHGNMAVCGVSEEGRAHCFHPHFLMIPTPNADFGPFLDYFSTSTVFSNLELAVGFGADRGQYVLVGASQGPFHVFLPDGEVPRQFARALVAEQLNVSHLASWKAVPDLYSTRRNAQVLRKVLS